MKTLALLLLPVLAAAATPAGPPDPLAVYFEPLATDQIALSPDGRHLAYPVREGSKLFLLIRNLDANSASRMYVGEDAVVRMSANGEKEPARLSFLKWADGDRLVFNFNGRNLWSVGADGGDPKRLADSHDFDVRREPPLMKHSVNGGQAPIIAPPPITSGIGQPVAVVALPTGSSRLFVSAFRNKNMGKPDFVDGADADNPWDPMLWSDSPATNKILRPFRAVLEVDVRSGKIVDESEITGPQSGAAELLADQEGRARVALWRQSLASSFAYAPSSGGHWKALDDFLPKDAALGFHLDPTNYFGGRSFPLGFDYDPDVLYFASNVGRDAYGVYALNLKSRRRTDLSIELPGVDLADPFTSQDSSAGVLVFDPWKRRLAGVRITAAERGTLWFDPALKAVQDRLDHSDPARTWEILDWDRSANRFLVLGSSDSDPGAYYLLDLRQNALSEVLARAPGLPLDRLSPRIGFGFVSARKVPITGYFTLPRAPRLKSPPLVVLCHDGPWSRDLPGFDPEVQALASLGFAVLQVNFRGSAGFGGAHLNALRQGFDRVALEDVLAAVEWAYESQGIDRRLVAVMGRGYGGYLALRALQLYPGVFRCGVAIDAPVDLPAWLHPGAAAALDESDDLGDAFDGQSPLSADDPVKAQAAFEANRTFAGEARAAFLGADGRALRELSPLAHPEQIEQPLLLVQSEGNLDAPLPPARRLKAALERAHRPLAYAQLGPGESGPLPGARAALFHRIGEFLDLNIYDYAVKVGELVEKK